MSARHALAALLLATASGLAGCASLGGPRETGELVFWRVARADGAGGSAHLLGSLHVAQAELGFDPAIESALGSADALVLEVAPNDLAPDATRALVQRLGPLPEGQTLRDVVSAKTFAAVEAEFAARKIAIEPWLAWKPWVVALALAGDALETEGFAREHGVERQLTHEAGAGPEPKPVRGLETSEAQIARLDSLSPQTQELLLSDAVSGSGERASVGAITEAWRRGDLRAIERAIFTHMRGTAAREFFEAIYYDRNRDFADDVARLVDGGGDWFVALGAAHMVGKLGIPALLAARGYRVERIPKSPASLAAGPEVR